MALANQRRLLLLCKLAQEKEASVGALAAHVGLSQLALSQHLARMRRKGSSPSGGKPRPCFTAR